MGERDFAKAMFEPLGLELLFSKVADSARQAGMVRTSRREVAPGASRKSDFGAGHRAPAARASADGAAERPDRKRATVGAGATGQPLPPCDSRETFHRATLSLGEATLLPFQESACAKDARGRQRAPSPGREQHRRGRRRDRAGASPLAAARRSPGWRDQRVLDRLHPAVRRHVPDDEVAVELPIGPAEAVLLRLAAHRRRIGGAQPDRGAALVVGAELAKQDRAAGWPRTRPRPWSKSAREPRPVGLAAPGDSVESVTSGPRMRPDE